MQTNNVQIRKMKNLVVDPTYLFYIRDFAAFAAKHIGLTTPVLIDLLDKTYDITSTGMYMIHRFGIKVLYEDRSLIDILRSIAHELQHQKQDEEKRIPDNPQNVGGELENEANIMCGILIKLYVQDRKHIYKL